MVRLNIFPKSYIYPKEARSVRDVLRRRQLFVQRRTQLTLSFQSLLERYEITASISRVIQKWSNEDDLNQFVQLQLKTPLDTIKCDDQLAKQIEEKVLEFVKPCSFFDVLQRVPGIGHVLGMTRLLESGYSKRFKNAGCYASYYRAVIKASGLIGELLASL